MFLKHDVGIVLMFFDEIISHDFLSLGRNNLSMASYILKPNFEKKVLMQKQRHRSAVQ